MTSNSYYAEYSDKLNDKVVLFTSAKDKDVIHEFLKHG